MNHVEAAGPPEITTAPPDEDLVAGLVRRDEAAVALLLERWWSRAYRLAHQLTGDAAAAEDVAQEAFVQALRGAEGFDPARGAFAPWFLRIVRNAAFNATRARRRRVDHEGSAARDRPEGTHDDVALRADATGVRAHLHALSPPYREALALHYLQGLTFQEVAEVLGCPLGTVASRVRRGLEALRARVTPTGSALAATPSLATPSLAPGADPLLDLLAQAWTLVAPPAAPAGARLLERAGASIAPAPPSTSPTSPTSPASPARWTSRAPALLALLGVFAAGTATVALLLHDPLTPPLPRQVVQVQPPRPTPPGVATTPPARARPTGIVVPAPTGGVVAPGGAVDPATPPAEERPQAVEAVAYDATGERALAGRRDGHVEVWNMKTGERLHRLAGHTARAVAVAFTPDGVLALSASYDGSARVWDVASGELVHVRRHATGAKRRVLALAVSPDGQVTATAGEDGLVHLWSVVTGERLTSLRAHAGAARAVAFDADGGQLLTAGEDHRVVLWSRRGDALATITTDAGYSHAVFDGRDVALVAGAPRTIERFDLVRRERVGTFAGEGPLAITPAAAPARERGLLVRAGAGAFTFVDPEKGQEKVHFADDDELLLAVALSPDGRHALTGAESGRLKVWDLRPPTPDTPVVTLGPPDSMVNAGDAGGERVIVAGQDGADARSATTAILPGPTAVDVAALRRELARATRARARELLRDVDPRDQAQLQLLLDVIGGYYDWAVRQAAIDALAAGLGDPRVQGAVFTVLDQGRPQPAVQEGLALAFGQTRSPVFVPRLVRLLASASWVVRRAAATALGRAPDARAVEPLIARLLIEEDAHVAARLHDALELTTRVYFRTGEEWSAWWKNARRDFVLQGPSTGDVGAPVVSVEVSDAADTRSVSWTARVRGQGPPMLVLPDLGYGPGYLETTLRWLESTYTMVYVGMREPWVRYGEALDADQMARRLARLGAALRALELIPDRPELVFGHGLSALAVSLYPQERPQAAGLILVSPITTQRAWTSALARASSAARDRGDGERESALRVLIGANAPNVRGDKRADLRRELFTQYFADTRDLEIGHLLGPQVRDTGRHALEWGDEQRVATSVARGDHWHEVPSLVIYGQSSVWSTADDANALALQARRSRVVPLSTGSRMPFYEKREAFEHALRWLR